MSKKNSAGTSALVAGIFLATIAIIIYCVSLIEIPDANSSSSINSDSISQSDSNSELSTTNQLPKDKFIYGDARSDFIDLATNKASVAHYISFDKNATVSRMEFEVNVIDDDNEPDEVSSIDSQSRTFRLSSTDIVYDYETDCKIAKVVISSLPFNQIIRTRFHISTENETIYTQIRSGTITSTSFELDSNKFDKTIKKLNYSQTLEDYYLKTMSTYGDDVNYLTIVAGVKKSEIDSVAIHIEDNSLNGSTLDKLDLDDENNFEVLISHSHLTHRIESFKFNIDDLGIPYNIDDYVIFGAVVEVDENIEYTLDFSDANGDVKFTSDSFSYDSNSAIYYTSSENYLSYHTGI